MVIETSDRVNARSLDETMGHEWPRSHVDVVASIHVLAASPEIAFRGADPYPSVTIGASSEFRDSRFTLTLTGNRAMRLAVATRLREGADEIERWAR